MHHKYVISREGVNGNLRIQEYADLERKLKKLTPDDVDKKVYSLLYEENYDSDTIQNSMSIGMNELMSALRTVNLYPIKPYVSKIAESVTALYNGSEIGPVSLYFNDMDLMAIEPVDM